MHIHRQVRDGAGLSLGHRVVMEGCELHACRAERQKLLLQGREVRHALSHLGRDS